MGSFSRAGLTLINVQGLDGHDTFFGGSENDRVIWNVGDGSDVIEGQAGTDTMDISSIENLAINARGGDDVVDADAFGLGALIAIAIDGGAGNDGVSGSEGADLIQGGDGNDSL